MKTLFLVLALSAASAYGSITATVKFTFDIIGDPPGPLSMAFQLADGEGTGDSNNSAILSNFQFANGGGIWGSPVLIDGASGDLFTTVFLTDSGPANIFIQGFTPGVPATVQFDLFLTTNLDAGGTPDLFIWSILDSTFNPLPTTSSSPLFPVLSVEIDSANPVFQTFGSSLESPVAGGFAFFSAPEVTFDDPNPVPEPSTVLLSAAGLGLLALVRRRTTQERRFACQ